MMPLKEGKVGRRKMIQWGILDLPEPTSRQCMHAMSLSFLNTTAEPPCIVVPSKTPLNNSKREGKWKKEGVAGIIYGRDET
jgi:hypothetical protein